MAAISTGGMWFPVVFAVATALPVAVVAWLLAYSIAWSFILQVTF
jgi:cytochrome c-type biogenesis protein